MAQDDLITFEGGVLVADLLVSADTSHELELTQHAIENGASINDHAIIKPLMLELTLLQTESPLSAARDGRFAVTDRDLSYTERPQATQQGQADVPQPGLKLSFTGLLTAGISAIGLGPPKVIKWTGAKSDSPVAGKSLKVQVLGVEDSVARVNEFHETLFGLWQSVAPITVTVKGLTLHNLIITSIKRTDAQGKAGCATFALSLQQITTVETLTVELPPVPKATQNKSRGKVSTDTPSAPVREKTAAAALLFGDS